MEYSSIHPLSDSTITYRDHDPSLLLQIPSPREEDVGDGGTRRTDEGAESNPRKSTGHRFHHPHWNGRNSCENLATSKTADDPLRHRSCLVGSRGDLVGTCECDESHALSSSIPPTGLKMDYNSYPSTLEAAKTWDRFANGSPRPFYINLNGNYRTSASASAITSDSTAARGASALPIEYYPANNPHNRYDPNPNTNESATNCNTQPAYAARILTAESRTDAAGNAYTSYVMHVEILSPPSLRPSYSTTRTPGTATATTTNPTSTANASPPSRPNNSHHNHSHQNNNNDNTTIAIIEHRYSEFHKLQNQLLANRIFLRAPFPKKHWAGNLNVSLNFNLNFNVKVASDLGGLVGLASKRGRNARGARRRHADDAAYREGVVPLECGASDSFDDDDDVVDDVPCGRNVDVYPSDDSKSNTGGRTILTEKAARSRAEVIELRKIQLDMWLSELCLELNKGGAGRLGGDDNGSMGQKDEGDCSIDGTVVRSSEKATKEREVVDEDEWEDVSAASVPIGATATDDNHDKMTPPTLRQQVIEFLTVSSANRPPCDRYNPVDWDDIFNSQRHQPLHSNNQKLMQPQQQSKSNESGLDHDRSGHNQTNKRQSPTKIDKDAPGIQKILSNPLSTTLGSSIRAATYTLMNMCGMRPELATGKNYSKSSPFSSSSSSSALKAMNSSDRRIPLELLQRAKGLVFLTVAKMGFLISGRVGTGLIVSRLDSGGATQSRPRWSAPSAIGTLGVGWGALVGGDIATYLIVLTTRKAVAAFSSPTGTVNLGAELGIAVGPVGRGASGHVNTGGEDMSPASFAPAYAYVHSKGLFVGISIESSVVSVRRDVNSKFYGREVDVEDLLAGKIERPRAAQPLYDALDWCLHVDRSRDYYLQFGEWSNVGNTEGRGCVGGGGHDVVEDDNDEDDYETADYLYGSNYGRNTQLFESMTYNGRNYGDASFHGGGCLSYSSCR